MLSPESKKCIEFLLQKVMKLRIRSWKILYFLFICISQGCKIHVVDISKIFLYLWVTSGARCLILTEYQLTFLTFKMVQLLNQAIGLTSTASKMTARFWKGLNSYFIRNGSLKVCQQLKIFCEWISGLGLAQCWRSTCLSRPDLPETRPGQDFLDGGRHHGGQVNIVCALVKRVIYTLCSKTGWLDTL